MEHRGNCYSTAVNNQLEKTYLLVCHGIVHGQGELEGYEYPHAWNEIEDTVIDTSNGNYIFMSKKEYYKIGKIEESKVIKYSYREVLENITNFETYGPWDERLNFDCRKID